jgi:hypothetical protein
MLPKHRLTFNENLISNFDKWITCRYRINSSRDREGHQLWGHSIVSQRTIIIAFTRALHLSLTWASPIQSIPPSPSYLSKIHLNVIHPLPSWTVYWSLFPSGFPTKNLSAFSRICARCPAYLVLLAHSNYTRRRAQVMKLLITEFSLPSCHFIQMFSSGLCS